VSVKEEVIGEKNENNEQQTDINEQNPNNP